MWVGCRTTILKGVKIPDNVVVASNALITKPVDSSNVIVGGIGENKIIRTNIDWEL